MAFVFALFSSLAGLVLLVSTANRTQTSRLAVTFVWLSKVALTYLIAYSTMAPEIDSYLPSMLLLAGYENEALTFDQIPLQPSKYAYPTYVLFGSWLVGAVNVPSAALSLVSLNLLVGASSVSFIMLTLSRFRLGTQIPLWTVSLVFYVPNTLIYDAVVARDSLSFYALLVSVFAGGSLLWLKANKASSLVTFSVGLLLIMVLRPPLLLLIFSIMVSLLLTRTIGMRTIFTNLFTTAIAVSAPLIFFAAAQQIQILTGSTSRLTRTIVETSSASFSASPKLAVDVRPNGSLTEVLLPETALEQLLFIAPRGLAAVIAPIGAINISMSETGGLLFAAESLTSVLVVLVTPLLVSIAIASFKERFRNPVGVIAWLPAILSALFLGAATLIIHERYRLIVSGFLVLGAWCGLDTRGLRASRPFLLAGLLLAGISLLFWGGRFLMS